MVPARPPRHDLSGSGGRPDKRVSREAFLSFWGGKSYKPADAALFEEWVETCLVPTLARGDVVIMDNLSSHKGPRVEELMPRVEELIKAAGAELRFLPPCSPDMNPIEKAFSKLKAHLRKIAGRTAAGLMRALQACADIFKPAECAHYFAACGYDTA